MHGFDGRSRHEPVADIGVVGDNHNQESRALKGSHCSGHAWQQTKILDAARRIRLATAHIGAVDYAVTVEEDGAAQVRVRFVGAATGPATTSFLFAATWGA